jgi:3-deoxy-D-manno-octulosonate 8-phosphate phosphatase KdsC-like HAD superfamily phosphatase
VDDPVPVVSATVTDTVLDAPVVTKVGFSVTVTDVDRAEMLSAVLVAEGRPLLAAVTV